MNTFLAFTLTLSIVVVIVLPPLQSLAVTSLTSAFNGARGRERWKDFLEIYLSILRWYLVFFGVIWAAVALVFGVILLFQTIFNFFV